MKEKLTENIFKKHQKYKKSIYIIVNLYIYIFEVKPLFTNPYAPAHGPLWGDWSVGSGPTTSN